MGSKRRQQANDSGRVRYLLRLAETVDRSEEHTSELQSPYDLVCRLLLDPAPTYTYPLSLHDALPIYPNAPIGLLFSGDPGFPGNKANSLNQYRQLAPRFGLVWDPSGDSKQTIRAGFGIYYDSPKLWTDRKSTRLNSSHRTISYAVFCLIPPPPTPTLFPYTTLFRSIRTRPSAYFSVVIPDSPAIKRTA